MSFKPTADGKTDYEIWEGKKPPTCPGCGEPLKVVVRTNRMKVFFKQDKTSPFGYEYEEVDTNDYSDSCPNCGMDLSKARLYFNAMGSGASVRDKRGNK